MGTGHERQPERVRLVVLFGGRSAEHEVSCTSAASVMAVLDPGRYDVVPVAITTDGCWVRAEGALAAVGTGPSAGPAPLEAVGPKVDAFAALTTPRATTGEPTVVLPLVHGPMGEDGTVQGLLELAGAAYVGAGVLGSALCMDKAKAKDVLGAAGIPQARHLALPSVEVDAGLVDRVEAELGWPVFVKPANMGSSVGISRVDRPFDLDAAVELALGYDEWVVIEEALAGRELECGVLGNFEPEPSVVGEVVPRGQFYDYEDKYSDSGAELVVPAEVDGEVAAEVRRLAVAAALALRAEGMARVDFFWEEGGRGLLVNEVNTIPGFTARSMYPRLWASSGVPYAELIDRLVALALDRHARRAGRVGRPRR